MNKATTCGFTVGQKATIHHHRVVHWVAPHLQQRHQQQNRARLANIKRLKLKNRRIKVARRGCDDHEQRQHH